MEKQEITQEKATRLFNKLLWGGFIAACLLILQAFVVTTPDIAIYISLGAVSIAIPLLVGCLVTASFEEEGVIEFKDWTGIPLILAWIGIVSTLIGVDAALWHVLWLLGVAFLISTLVTAVVFYTYIDRNYL